MGPKDVPWNRIYTSPGEPTIHFAESGSYLTFAGGKNITLDDNETTFPKKAFEAEDYYNGKWSGTVDWSPSSYKGQAKWYFTDWTFTSNFGYVETGKKKIAMAKYDWEAKKEWQLGKDLMYSFSQYDYNLNFNQTTSTSPPWVDPNDTTAEKVLDCNVWKYHKNSDIEKHDFVTAQKYQL